MRNRRELPPVGSQQRHSAWQHLLQIAGTVAIVAFHTQAPLSQAGWVAVELFFVLAGMHMTPALNRGTAVVTYARYRVIRIFPEVALVWTATLIWVFLAGGTDGMLWFLVTAPFQLQNITPLFFNYQLPQDAIFGPIWFLGALFQIQLLVCIFKRPLKSFKPSLIITTTLLLGIVSRLLFGVISGHPITLEGKHAGILYCMPFCHLEAVVLGVLINNGKLPELGRKMPLIVGLVLIFGFLNYRLSSDKIHAASLGYEFPLRINLSYLWGYPALAFAAASLCAQDSKRAYEIFGSTSPLWLTNRISEIAALTYGVYCFHGLFISTSLNAIGLLDPSKASHVLLFAFTFMEALLLAWLFARLKERIFSCGDVKIRTV